jgi:5-methylcytosine-specific restriction endonuclease McrA
MNQSGENTFVHTGLCRWCETPLDSEHSFDSCCSLRCRDLFYSWVEREHASIRGRRPQFWNVIRRQILQRDGYRCQICGQREDLSVHHIIPLSEGGDSTSGNLRVLCHTCHQKVHGKKLVRTRTKKKYRIRIRYKPMFVPALEVFEWPWNDQGILEYALVQEQR